MEVVGEADKDEALEDRVGKSDGGDRCWQWRRSRCCSLRYSRSSSRGSGPFLATSLLARAASDGFLRVFVVLVLAGGATASGSGWVVGG